jgi:Ca2+-binding RTX toxin-like protein
MAISTNGTVIARVAGALYNTQLSNATYAEVAGIVTTSASLNALINDLYARDFATTADLKVAQTLVGNLGLSEVVGLDNWVAAQITAAGAANKGAKIVELLNSFAQMSSDATYGTAATAFNTKTDAALSLSQTAGNTGGTFAAAGTVVNDATFTLTQANDTVLGGAGNDYINGSASTGSTPAMTYSSLDAVNGGAGIDTLYVEPLAATSLNLAGVTNVETLRVGASSGALAVTLPTAKGYSSLDVAGNTGNVTFSAAKVATLSGYLLNTASGATITYNLDNTTFAGATDSLTISANGAAGTLAVTGLTTNKLETVNVVAADADSAFTGITLTSMGVSTVKVSGSANINLGTITDATVGGATAKTIDASAATGAVTAAAVSAISNTLTGGSGNDALTDAAGNDTISGGAGADTITGSTGNDSIDGGAGNDRVSVSGIDKYDVIKGGDDTDTLVLGAALAYSTTADTNDGVGISGFETLELTAAVAQDMTALSGNSIKTVTVNTTDAGFTLTKAPATLDTVSLKKNTAASSITLTTGTGTTDTLNVSLAPSSSTGAITVASLTASDMETVNITSAGTIATGTANTISSLVNTSMTKMTIDGANALSVTTSGTKVATIDATNFSGEKLTVSAASSTSAITFTPGAGGSVQSSGVAAYTVTTGTGADNITGTAFQDSITSGEGADTITSGAGKDTISSGAGADVISAGDGNDTVTAGTGADSIDAGAGDDTIDGGADADTILGGTGNDSIDASTGNDNVDGGTGNDTITAGTGSDTINGGDGDDKFVMGSNLSSADSIVGGAGTDQMDATIGSSVTPVGISTVEVWNSAGSAGFVSGSALDLKNVTGVTTFIAGISGTSTVAVNTAPSTLTKVYLADAGATGTVTLDWDSSPSAVTIYTDSLDTGALTTTDADSVTISQLLTSDYQLAAGVAATDATTRVYTSSQNTLIDSITTSARDLTLSVGNLTAGTDVASNYELAVNDGSSAGAITASTLENLTVSAGNYAGINVVGATTTNATGVSTVTITAGTGGEVALGGVTATSATALTSVTVTGGEAATVSTGGLNFGSATIDAVTITGGTASSMTTGTLTAATITALTINDGAASSNGTFGTIAAKVTGGSITLGTSTTETITFSATSGTFGSSTSPIYVYGTGALTVNMIGTSGAINGSTMGAGFKVDADSTGGLSGAVTVTGGSYNDTVFGGDGSDVITIGEGADSVDGAAGSLDHVSFAGRALPISITLNTTVAATYSVNGGSGVGSIVNVEKITGTSYDDTITGDSAANYLLGGSGNDAIDSSTGADTINGGLGNDTITGGGGADSLIGGGGNDIFVFNSDSGSAVTISSSAITGGTALTTLTSVIETTNADVITDFLASDVLRFTTVHAMSLGTAGTPTDNKVVYVKGVYDATAATFTYNTSVTSATSGYATLALYDTNATVGTTSFNAVVLVGYLDGDTADAFTTTGVTGLVGVA